MDNIDLKNQEVLCNEQSETILSDNLCSSQPNIDLGKVNAEPIPRVINSAPMAVIPPRNYRSVLKIPGSGNMYNTMYNRLPSTSSRYPYNGYSAYGYNQSYLPFNSGMSGGYGMGAYNMNNTESRFIRAAADGARPTFHAIETVTQAINSVAFMMDSTFGSLNMSFQAILSVIESFSHARKVLKQFITSILTLRIFHKFLRMLVNLMRAMNIISEEAVAQLPLLNNPTGNSQSSVSIWPILSFFGLIFGAPYIISRMLPHEDDLKSESNWNPNTDSYVSLVGVHDFKAGNDQELSFSKGQQLKMMPIELMPSASPYWVFVADSKNNQGFVPKNHVAPVPD